MKFDFLPFQPRRKTRSEFGGEFTVPGDTMVVSFLARDKKGNITGEWESDFAEVISLRRLPASPARWAATAHIKHGRHAGTFEVIV